MRLAAVLLLLVAMTHYLYAPLATLYPDADRAARALFYVARGIEGLALFGLVGVLARQPLVWAVCLWGAVEEGQTAVCRLAAGVGGRAGAELFSGLCGPVWYGLGLVAGLALALWLHRENKKCRTPT